MMPWGAHGGMANLISQASGVPDNDGNGAPAGRGPPDTSTPSGDRNEGEGGPENEEVDPKNDGIGASVDGPF